MSLSVERKVALGGPCLGEEEFEATRKIFGRQWIADGPEVRRFEDVLKQYTGSPFAAAVANGTAGLHLALAALDLPAESEVLLPSLNFVADGLSILHARLRPVFVEADPKTGNMDPQDLAKKITSKAGAILVLHYAGYPADMNKIQELAKKHRLKVVEDAAHGLGAVYDGKPVGSLGDAGVFSFGPLKLITTGSGGMVACRDESMHQKMVILRAYGMDKSGLQPQHKSKPWKIHVEDLGHNYKMNDFQAAVGIVQLSRLEELVNARKKCVARYQEALAKIKAIHFFEVLPGAVPVPLYYVVKIQEAGRPALRDELLFFLRQRGIEAGVHWDPPLHCQPLFRSYGYAPGDLLRTEELASQMLTLPLSSAMKEDDLEYTVQAIASFFKGS